MLPLLFTSIPLLLQDLQEKVWGRIEETLDQRRTTNTDGNRVTCRDGGSLGCGCYGEVDVARPAAEIDGIAAWQRPDVGAATGCAGKTKASCVMSERKKKEESTGKPSQPNESWIRSTRKTQRSGLPSSISWAAKGTTDLAREKLARARLAHGNDQDPPRKLGCQRRPYGASALCLGPASPCHGPSTELLLRTSKACTMG